MANDTKNQELQKASPARAPSLVEEMHHLFDKYFHPAWTRHARFDWPAFPEMALPEMKMPKVDIVDRESEVVVTAEIPGIDKKDLDISVGEDTVTIQGATSSETKEEKGDYYRCEISRGSFSRTLALPAAVDGSKAAANFKDGVLELTLPKIKVATRHKVDVK